MGTSGNYMVDSLSIDKNFNVSDFANCERKELFFFFYENILGKKWAQKNETLLFNAFVSNAKMQNFSDVSTDLQDGINAAALKFNLIVLRGLFSKIATTIYFEQEMFCEDLSLFANLFAEVYKDFYSFVEYEYHLDYQIQMDISAAEFNTISNFISEKLFWNEKDTQYFCQELKANFGK